MATDRGTLRNNILRRLGDTDLIVWDASEINTYIDEGYKKLCEETGALWDIAYLENIPYTGSHTADWELDYVEADMVYYKQFNYTYDWEIDYINNGIGPANHTYAWEWINEYVSTEYIAATEKLPSDFYRIERATHDWRKIDPWFSQSIELNDRVYQKRTGDVVGYIMNKDGLRTFRKYAVPANKCDYYDVTGTWGIARDLSDIDDATPSGTWGIPRLITGEHPIGPYRFGLPRRLYDDTNNVRIEFSRRPRPVENDTDEFEILDIYVKYIRHYVMFKALSKEGAGQDLKLSNHFKERYDEGIDRINRRKIDVKKNRVGSFGRRDIVKGKRPPRPVLPWNYGRVVK